MQIEIEKGNPFQILGQQYKDMLDKKTRAITMKNYKAYLAKKYILWGIPTVKYDGSLNVLYWNGTIAKLYSARSGCKVRFDFGVTDEINRAFKGKPSFIVMGELYGVNPDKTPMKFNKYMSASQVGDGFDLRFAVFDILQINNQPYPAEKEYSERISEISKMFKGLTYTHPVESLDSPTIDGLYSDAIKGGFEGLMVRADKYIWKIKPSFTLDAVIYAMDKSGPRMKMRPPQIGAVYTALVVNKGGQEYLLDIGKVGNGWLNKERETLYAELLANKIGEDETKIYVKAKHIIEIEFSMLQPSKRGMAFAFKSDGSYTLTEKEAPHGKQIVGIAATTQHLRFPKRTAYMHNGVRGDYPMISDEKKKVNAVDLGDRQIPNFVWSINV